MATTVVNPGFKDVQWLLDHAGADGMVVSCYVDTSASSGVRSLWREHLKRDVNGADQGLAGDPAARAEFHRNLAAIESVLSSRRGAGEDGLAVFAASHRGFLQAYALSSAVPNRLVVGEEPYLVPLLEWFHRQRRYLVVHADIRRARLYTAVPGAMHTIEDIEEPVPRRRRAAGAARGATPSTIERQHEDHLLHYLRELAHEIERAWPEERYDGIVLLGEHAVLDELRRHLPERLRSQVVGEAPHAWTGRQVSLVSKIEAIHASAVRAQERRLFEDLGERLPARHHVATGPQPVIDAMQDGTIGDSGCVVMEPDSGAVASRCTGCQSLFARSVHACSTCRARCEKTNLWQAIALLAARQRVTVHVVEPGHGLDAHAGVVALLGRDIPWMAPALTAALPEWRA